jgi:hypothetical protein
VHSQPTAKQSGGSFGNLYYSWDYGNIHFIALDSESFEYFQMSPQHIWLKQDLHNVNRTKTPWVVAFWHSPWYCSNTGTLSPSLEHAHVHAHPFTCSAPVGRMADEGELRGSVLPLQGRPCAPGCVQRMLSPSRKPTG